MTALYKTEGLAVSPFDQGAPGGDPPRRFIELLDQGEKHESGMRYELRIHHPPFVAPPYGNRSAQVDEVFRFNGLPDAQRAYRVYTKALGGDPKDCPEPSPSDAIPPADRFVPRRDYDALLERLEAIERKIT